jgi:hypothetical protein
MTSHYQPIYRSADLAPTPMPAAKFTRTKLHKAVIYSIGRPISFSALRRSGHTHALLYYGRGTAARWCMELAGSDPAPMLHHATDIAQHWRIVATDTGIIEHEG